MNGIKNTNTIIVCAVTIVIVGLVAYYVWNNKKLNCKLDCPCGPCPKCKMCYGDLYLSDFGFTVANNAVQLAGDFYSWWHSVLSHGGMTEQEINALPATIAYYKIFQYFNHHPAFFSGFDTNPHTAADLAAFIVDFNTLSMAVNSYKQSSAVYKIMQSNRIYEDTYAIYGQDLSQMVGSLKKVQQDLNDYLYPH